MTWFSCSQIIDISDIAKGGFSVISIANVIRSKANHRIEVL